MAQTRQWWRYRTCASLARPSPIRTSASPRSASASPCRSLRSGEIFRAVTTGPRASGRAKDTAPPPRRSCAVSARRRPSRANSHGRSCAVRRVAFALGEPMRVAIHQPHYLPWLGLLHRMAEADLFIVLDHVQFERGNYQNRTQVRVNGAPHWLTVPVLQRSQKERIVEKTIDATQDWAATHFETLRRAYG